MDSALAIKIKEANQSLFMKGDLDQVEKYFSSNYKAQLTGKVLKGGHGAVRTMLESLLRSFSDIKVEIDVLLEHESRISWQRTLHVTHTGKFKNFPASGDKLVWRDMVTSQFQNGVIKEEWLVTDLAEQLLLARKKKS